MLKLAEASAIAKIVNVSVAYLQPDYLEKTKDVDDRMEKFGIGNDLVNQHMTDVFATLEIENDHQSIGSVIFTNIKNAIDLESPVIDPKSIVINSYELSIWPGEYAEYDVFVNAFERFCSIERKEARQKWLSQTVPGMAKHIKKYCAITGKNPEHALRSLSEAFSH